MIGILPTRNTLVRMKLTGEQLLQVVKERRPLVAGMEETPEGFVMASGSPLDPHATYQVLLPDTLYLGGNYYDVARFDPSPVYTGIDWREPMLAKIRSLRSSREHPLEDVLGPIGP